MQSFSHLKNPAIKLLTHADFSDVAINISPIESIGIDRLVNVVATLHHYQSNAIIVDAGTVITCCHINAKGEYNGGIILPGFHMVRNANSMKMPNSYL